MLRTIAASQGVVVPSGESTVEDEGKDYHDNPALAHYRLPGSTDNTQKWEFDERNEQNAIYTLYSILKQLSAFLLYSEF